MFGHKNQTAEKIFLFIYFFLGEKLCLKICTVVNKVIENRFLLKRKPAFLLKHHFSAGFDLFSHETTKSLSAIFTHESRSAEKNVSTCIFFPR
jgi:hypothetical protein